MRRLVDSHFDRPRIKGNNDHYLITEISKKGSAQISYKFLSQVLDYFKSAVSSKNVVKLKYFK